MKILVIVDSINIEDSSGSKANVALINNLHTEGFEVLVYHYTLKDIELKNIQTYAIQEIKISKTYVLSRLQRFISRNLKVNLAPFLEGLFGFSFTFFNDTRSIQKTIEKIAFQPDFVLTLSKGASFRSHYAVLKLTHLHNKWIAYVHDPFPFHFYPRPYNWVQSSYRQKEKFFNEVAIKARYSAFPSQLLKEWMSSYFPDFEKTGIIIPHQNEKYKIQNTSFPSYFNASKFNLLHAGNLMKQRSPEGLIKGFNLFLEQNPEAKIDARLLLLGNASYHAEMLKNYKKNSPEVYIYNGNKPFDEVYNLQKNVSVNIILEAKGEISPFLPAKFPHCVEANKVILLLAPYYSETRRLLGKDYEFWSEVDDIQGIALLIEKLYFLWKEKSVNLNLNRHDLVEYVSSRHLKEILEKITTN
ncbi:Glycosyltransferase involved in cell wall bisynthesis [Flavobacterium aquidurense]|uniref:Uncharacterized protein n=1 Tax=Flavobacterium frigidimaris TaxID=262320 RepID=A0ABX4BUY1_FLAFR|nr:hypothetical protein [Flavobacterium frigidimaris]OXA81466.1 hypothetical protein B0A65_04200 [Flavobacterium frigidimaris]SDZ05168.1 Glycosyltransferase involved in cell wall bisynthesis [Flavobacterium aquidurense]